MKRPLAIALSLALAACAASVRPVSLVPVNSACSFSVPYLSVGQVDQKPKTRSAPRPEFPKKLQSIRDFVGLCVVEVVVDTTGAPITPQVARADDKALGEAAVTAVAQWKFMPGLRAGAPVACRIRVPFVFFTVRDLDRKVYDEIGKSGDLPPYLVEAEDESYLASPVRAGLEAKPNKAPQSTPSSVTPPAGQEARQP